MERQKLIENIRAGVKIIWTSYKFILWISFFYYVFNLARGCEFPLAFVIIVSGVACFLISIYIRRLRKHRGAKIAPLGIWIMRLSQFLFFGVPLFVFGSAFGGWSDEQTIVTFSIAIAAIFFLILGIFFIKKEQFR